MRWGKKVKPSNGGPLGKQHIGPLTRDMIRRVDEEDVSTEAY